MVREHKTPEILTWLRAKSSIKPPGSPIFRRAKREILGQEKETEKKVNFYVSRNIHDSDDEEIELEKI